MYMKTFLLILKRILIEKYPNVDFYFYLSSRSKNFHMGLNLNIVPLPEHIDIISENENIWKEKRQDTKFRFVIPQLIHTPKWKDNYIVFRGNT